MSADVSSKEPREQAGMLGKMAIGVEHWQPYRGTSEIEQYGHPDRKQRVKPFINAMNLDVSSRYSCIFMKILIGV
jgi:hypothetical protein